MKTLASVIVFAFCIVPMAYGIPCIVESTDHGGGLFSYTFRRGDDPYVWGLGTDFGTVYLQSYGVIEVQEPPGWTHSISPSGRITWAVTSGVAFLDEPATFTVNRRDRRVWWVDGRLSQTTPHGKSHRLIQKSNPVRDAPGNPT